MSYVFYISSDDVSFVCFIQLNSYKAWLCHNLKLPKQSYEHPSIFDMSKFICIMKIPGVLEYVT